MTTVLMVETVTKNGGAFKSGGIWYNLPRGMPCPPVGAQVQAQVTQGLNQQGQPKYSLQNLQVLSSGAIAQQPAYQAAQAYAPAVAQLAALPAIAVQAPAEPAKPDYKPYVNDRGAHDTTAEQKLRYNALGLAVELVKDGNLDAVLSIGAELYAVIKDGFTEQKLPVQQVAVQAPKARKAAPVPQAAQQAVAQYSAFQQPEFGEDDLPFDA